MAQIIEFPTNDVVVQLMHASNAPKTRENYIQIACFGESPNLWKAEHEDKLPAVPQNWSHVKWS